MAEFRRDPLLQRWVIISDKRGKRPSDFKTVDGDSHKPGPCAFCPGFERETGREVYAVRDGRDGAGDWELRVVVNMFPAVSAEAHCGPPSGEEDPVLGECRSPGYGSHEVVIETPNHDLSLADLPVLHVAEVLKSYQVRLKEFRKNPRLKYCQIFKNKGRRAGASMTHSHSQIVALPIIVYNMEEELRGAKAYYDEHNTCIFCDVVSHVTTSNLARLIDQNEHFVTLAPYAPRFPYETWLLPKQHASNYETICEDKVLAMAELLKLTLKKFEAAFEFSQYNYMLQTTPLEDDYYDNQYYHWYLCLVPHLETLGGFELTSGCYMNSVSPEKAAEVLRNTNV